MPKIADVVDLPVFNHKDKRVGTVSHVLFHPAEPRVVGFEVQPKNVGYVVGLPPKYVFLEDVTLAPDRVTLGEKGYSSERAAEKRFGFIWDETVIWRNMEVRTVSGKMRGYAQEVHFGDDGAIEAMSVSSGMTNDAAVGRRNVEPAKIVGFDGDDVIVEEDAATEDDFEGGLAANAGAHVAVAKVTAEVAAKKTVEIGKATARVAAQSETAKTWGGAFKGFFEEARDAMTDDKPKAVSAGEDDGSSKDGGE